MTDTRNVLLVTIGDDDGLYDAGREAIRRLEEGQPVDDPPVVTFATAEQLTDVFNERTYTLLGVVRDEEPASIRETARLVGRDVKNVHEELTTLEALGVVRFVEERQAKRPVFPYDDLVISPLARHDGDATVASS